MRLVFSIITCWPTRINLRAASGRERALLQTAGVAGQRLAKAVS